MTVQELLTEQAKIRPQRGAVFFEGKDISFLELKETSFKLANYLLCRNQDRDEKIALYLSNIPETIFSFLGIFSADKVCIPLDFMLTQEEIITFLNHSQAKVLITQAKNNIDLSVVKEKCQNLEEIIICKEENPNFTNWNDALSGSGDLNPQEVLDKDLLAIFYTSGSTGHPKGVMVNAGQLRNPAYAIDYFLGVTDKDVFLCGGVPFSHIGGLAYILLTITFASKLILMQRFQPFEFLKNVQEHKVSIFCIVPAMFVALLSLKEYERFDLSSLRYAAVFGAPSSPALLKRFHKAYPNAKLCNGWGMTETAAPNTLSEPGDEHIRSIGKFVPEVEVRIVDNQGNKLKANQNGELWIKGEAIMSGYFKEEALTKEVLTEDGWLKTGDVAYFDRQGFYYIVGRKKDMIKVAGEIVFLAEVEEKILKFPKVKEVAVIGVSDKLRGEVPKAYLAICEGQIFNEQEIKEFLKEHIAHFKIPHYFEVLEELPKNRVGKIDKTKLVFSK
tara:strand:- start:2974 stop:4479 length:1506 start_codon:yes stop_codon:yes gene_type:complete